MIKQIIKRLRAETPSFFKKIRNIMVSCGVLGGMLISTPNIYIPSWLPANTGSMLVTVGVIGTFLTSLVTKEPTEADKK